MEKIDPHIHSNEISKCALCNLRETLKLKKEQGYDAVVLTNHAHPFDYDKEGVSFNLKHYKLYKDNILYADSIGILMLLGIEVTLVEPSAHILIYGTNEDFYKDAPKLSYLSLKELYEYAHTKNCFVVQAHPYRGGSKPVDARYIDGIEINCREDDLALKDKVIKYAKENNLVITCGTDYHAKPNWPIGGMYIPDEIKNNAQFVEFLMQNSNISIFFEENKYRYLNLRQCPEEKDKAAQWFHEKWGIEKQEYLKCMDDYISGKSELGWYICKDKNKIVGGVGVIENDFHNRKDLTPDICALYVEPEYRKQGIAGKLLGIAVSDLRIKEIYPVYLLTNHVGFYERYGWKFLEMVQGDNDDYLSRMYIHNQI